jgi:hypothetical protein
MFISSATLTVNLLICRMMSSTDGLVMVLIMTWFSVSVMMFVVVLLIISLFLLLSLPSSFGFLL